MKRLVLLVALFAFLRWRRSRFDACDREHGYGAYAALQPVVT